MNEEIFTLADLSKNRQQKTNIYTIPDKMPEYNKNERVSLCIKGAGNRLQTQRIRIKWRVRKNQ